MPSSPSIPNPESAARRAARRGGLRPPLPPGVDAEVEPIVGGAPHSESNLPPAGEPAGNVQPTGARAERSSGDGAPGGARSFAVPHSLTSTAAPISPVQTRRALPSGPGEGARPAPVASSGHLPYPSPDIFDVDPNLEASVDFEIWRLEPEYYKDLRIAGFWQRVAAPFGIEDLRQRQGGGLYRVRRLEGGRAVSDALVEIGMLPPRVNEYGAEREAPARERSLGAADIAGIVELAVGRAIGIRESSGAGKASATQALLSHLEEAEKFASLLDRLRGGKTGSAGSFLRDIPSLVWEEGASFLRAARDYFLTRKPSAPAAPAAQPNPEKNEPSILDELGPVDEPTPAETAPLDYNRLREALQHAARSILSYLETESPKLKEAAEEIVEKTPGIEEFLTLENRPLIRQYLLTAIGQELATHPRDVEDLAELERTIPGAADFFIGTAIDAVSDDDEGAGEDDDEDS